MKIAQQIDGCGNEMFCYQFHSIHDASSFAPFSATLQFSAISSPTLITQRVPEAKIFYRSSINKFQDMKEERTKAQQERHERKQQKGANKIFFIIFRRRIP